MFLGVGAYLCLSGFLALKSQHAYLDPKAYNRRRDFVTEWKAGSKGQSRMARRSRYSEGLLVAAGVFLLGRHWVVSCSSSACFQSRQADRWHRHPPRLKGLTQGRLHRHVQDRQGSPAVHGDRIAGLSVAALLPSPHRSISNVTRVQSAPAKTCVTGLSCREALSL